jgi:DNA repair protein SbcD/Mre11
MQNSGYCTMKRIRILHTADLHLGASFATLGVNAYIGNQLCAAQQRVFEKIMQRANDWPADMVLIAGDLFDSTDVQAETVALVMETLEHLAPIPVYIVPGNRDPYVDNSPYATELWPENVTLFDSQEWQQCVHPSQEICIHGIGCNGDDDSGDKFNALSIEKDGRVHIALAHGTERSHRPPNGKCVAPFDAAAIAREGLAYLALGHFHEATEVKGDYPTAIHYPGTPQGRNFNEQGSRYFLEVNIEDGTSVRVTPISCEEVIFKEYACPVGTGRDPEGDLDRILEGSPEREVARLRVTGTLASPAYRYMEALQQHARRRFLHAEIVDATEQENTPSVLKGQATCMSRFNETMASRMHDAPDSETALFEAYARDLALVACRGQLLPEHDGEDPSQ